jgi:hypothetical protein
MQFHAMMVSQLRNRNLHAGKIQNWIALIVLLLFLILKAKATELSPVLRRNFHSTFQAQES